MAEQRAQPGDAVAGSNGTTRRKLLRQMGVLRAAAAWVPVFRIGRAEAAEGACTVPPEFPEGIDLYRQAYENWAQEIRSDEVWSCAPRSASEVVALANWAAAKGWAIRARGMRHTWAPLSITDGQGCQAKVVLCDTTQHLNGVAMVAGGQTPRVRAQPGVLMEVLLGFLESNGCGMTTCPAPGEITLGGVLAIDGHGAAVPANGETRKPGHTFGSLSNLIVSLNAVVYDPKLRRYVERTFARGDEEIGPFLTHLGRAFLTEVTLQVGANDNLRCVSRVDIPAAEMFGAPGGLGQTFQSFVEQTGRAEAIWFAFTDKPWLKTWQVAPQKPLLSRQTHEPYNYPFSDRVPVEMSDLAKKLVTGTPQSAPQFGQLSYEVVVAGLLATQSADLWGPSKNTLLYIRASTLRATANGYAVLTRRGDIQRVINDFYKFFVGLRDQYAARGEYPMNMPVEIRCTGLDRPDEVDGVAHPERPSLSALSEREDHPEWDTVVWFDVLTLVGTPLMHRFYCELEAWFFGQYTGSYATLRPEWSKGWAYTEQGGWTNQKLLTQTIPDLYRAARQPKRRWDAVVSRLDDADPYRIYSNPFLDGLLP